MKRDVWQERRRENKDIQLLLITVHIWLITEKCKNNVEKTIHYLQVAYHILFNANTKCQVSACLFHVRSYVRTPRRNDIYRSPTVSKRIQGEKRTARILVPYQRQCSTHRVRRVGVVLGTNRGTNITWYTVIRVAQCLKVRHRPLHKQYGCTGIQF